MLPVLLIGNIRHFIVMLKQGYIQNHGAVVIYRLLNQRILENNPRVFIVGRCTRLFACIADYADFVCSAWANDKAVCPPYLTTLAHLTGFWLIPTYAVATG